ncbi:hypothetical protein K0M31_008873 [Melipona bicolor]|uniref:Uncharacterized protein n=1 Tax=Melipona bicolor TaxID=60889 RepID=A0AA40KKC8_9HYME|nr:hypothetical protein K0M31_008873 [Melipona bicolor]
MYINKYVREKAFSTFGKATLFQLKVLEGKKNAERAVTMIMAIIAAISATIATVEITTIVAISTDIYNLFFSTASPLPLSSVFSAVIYFLILTFDTTDLFHCLVNLSIPLLFLLPLLPQVTDYPDPHSAAQNE